jgi:hypothetical protein
LFTEAVVITDVGRIKMVVKCNMYIQTLCVCMYIYISIYIYRYMGKTTLYKVTMSQIRERENILYREITKTSNPSPQSNKRKGQHIYAEVTETSNVTLQQWKIRKMCLHRQTTVKSNLTLGSH